ncbi:MAG: hypothetical protein OHK0017_00780 [Patescibacteria group bacterium]
MPYNNETDSSKHLTNDESSKSLVETEDKSLEKQPNFVFVESEKKPEAKPSIDDNVIEVDLSKAFNRPKTKVRTDDRLHDYSPAEKEEMLLKDKIGRKSYSNGKLNLKKLKLGIFSGGLKGFSKFLLAGFGVILIIILGVSIAGFAYVASLYQDTSIDYNRSLGKSSVIYARDGKTELFKIFGEDGKRQEINSLDELNDYTYLAFLALEDENYYKNNAGFSWYNLGGSIIKCGTSLGKDCRGGSTIDQQYARQITGDDTRDKDQVVQRKLREIVRAYKLNQELSKQEILRRYLNTVYFGKNSYGVKEAAISFFGKRDLKQLTVTESCYMASVLPSPNNYSNSFYNPESPFRKVVEARKDACIEKLSQLELKGTGNGTVITNQDAQLFKEEKVAFKNESSVYKYPHFIEYVRAEMIKVLANGDETEEGSARAEQLLANGGYRVVTTIDPELQDKVQKVIDDQAQKNILDNGADNAAAVVLDGPSGEIISMIGSRDYNNDEIDGKVNVTMTPQQPGSSMKPYVYATAFEQGFNPGTMMMDLDTKFDNDGSAYQPDNFTKTFSGPVSIRYALANSLNIPAVKAVWLAAGNDYGNNLNEIRKSGINNIITLSQRMGVKFQVFKNDNGKLIPNEREKCGPPIALGSCEITAVSHAEGMNTFAQMGTRVPATPFIQICNNKGEDVYNGKMCNPNETPDPNTTCEITGEKGICNIKERFYKKDDKALDPRIAYEIIDMMTDVEARRPVFGNTRFTLTLPDRKVAAKTGTSSENRDTWTVGYTPFRTAVVWVGRTDNKPTKDSSMRSAAPIWQNVMKVAVEGTPKDDFKRPDNMVAVKLSSITGLPDEGGTTAQWMTPEQKKILDDALAKSKPDKDGKVAFDPAKDDIFSLRTPLYGKTYTINTIDNKLVTDDNRAKIDPANIQDKYFICPLGEFPWAKSWVDPVAGFFANGKGNTDKVTFQCGPTELSTSYRADQTPPEDRPNISFGGFNDSWYYNQPVTISVQATPKVAGASIASTQILINGTVIAENKGDKIDFTMNPPGDPNQELRYRVSFRATDSKGNVALSPEYSFIMIAAGRAFPEGSNQGGQAPTTVNVTFSNIANNATITYGGPTNISNFNFVANTSTSVISPQLVFTKNGSPLIIKDMTPGGVNTYAGELLKNEMNAGPGSYNMTVSFRGVVNGQTFNTNPISFKVVIS